MHQNEVQLTSVHRIDTIRAIVCEGVAQSYRIESSSTPNERIAINWEKGPFDAHVGLVLAASVCL